MGQARQCGRAAAGRALPPKEETGRGKPYGLGTVPCAKHLSACAATPLFPQPRPSAQRPTFSLFVSSSATACATSAGLPSWRSTISRFTALRPVVKKRMVGRLPRPPGPSARLPWLASRPGEPLQSSASPSAAVQGPAAAPWLRVRCGLAVLASPSAGGASCLANSRSRASTRMAAAGSAHACFSGGCSLRGRPGKATQREAEQRLWAPSEAPQVAWLGSNEYITQASKRLRAARLTTGCRPHSWHTRHPGEWAAAGSPPLEAAPPGAQVALQPGGMQCTMVTCCKSGKATEVGPAAVSPNIGIATDTAGIPRQPCSPPSAPGCCCGGGGGPRWPTPAAVAGAPTAGTASRASPGRPAPGLGGGGGGRGGAPTAVGPAHGSGGGGGGGAAPLAAAPGFVDSGGGGGGGAPLPAPAGLGGGGGGGGGGAPREADCWTVGGAAGAACCCCFCCCCFCCCNVPSAEKREERDAATAGEPGGHTSGTLRAAMRARGVSCGEPTLRGEGGMTCTPRRRTLGGGGSGGAGGGARGDPGKPLLPATCAASDAVAAAAQSLSPPAALERAQGTGVSSAPDSTLHPGGWLTESRERALPGVLQVPGVLSPASTKMETAGHGKVHSRTLQAQLGRAAEAACHVALGPPTLG